MFRTVFLILLFVLSRIIVAAQQHGTARTFYYAEAGAYIGFPHHLRASVNVMLEKRHELSLAYHAYQRRGRDIPNGWNNSGFFGNQVVYPQQTFSGAALSYGYVIRQRKNPEMHRYVIRTGVVLGILTSPYNYRQTPGGGFFSFGPVWENDYEDRFTGGIVLNPVYQFTPAKAFGMSIGVYGVFCDGIAGGGVGGSLLLGKVGNRALPQQAARGRKKPRAKHN